MLCKYLSLRCPTSKMLYSCMIVVGFVILLSSVSLRCHSPIRTSGFLPNLPYKDSCSLACFLPRGDRRKPVMCC